MKLPPQLESPYTRAIPERRFESEQERAAYHELNYLTFWPFCDYRCQDPVSLDIGPSLAGNWHCANDMSLRTGLIRLMSLWLWNPEQIEDGIRRHRDEHEAIGLASQRCSCGRPHWLDPDQHEISVRLVKGAFRILNDLGVRDRHESSGHHRWSLALPPSLDLPPRITGTWDACVRQYWSMQQMMHVTITRPTPCPPPPGAARPMVKVPLHLALAVSAIAARHGGREATVGMMHLDSDTGEVHGVLGYVPTVETARVGLHLAEIWEEHRPHSEGASQARQ